MTARLAILTAVVVGASACAAVAEIGVPAEVLSVGRRFAGLEAVLLSAKVEPFDDRGSTGFGLFDVTADDAKETGAWVLRFEGLWLGMCPKTVLGSLACPHHEVMTVVVDAESEQYLTSYVDPG